MISWSNGLAVEQVRNRIVSTSKKIEVKAGKCKWNFRCSYNAVHYAIKSKDKKIAMVVYMDEGYPIIHFINYKNKVFTDNTLGEWSSQYDYYFIKWINAKELFEVNDVFEKYRKELRNNLSFWVRLTSNSTF